MRMPGWESFLLMSSNFKLWNLVPESTLKPPPDLSHTPYPLILISVTLWELKDQFKFSFANYKIDLTYIKELWQQQQQQQKKRSETVNLITEKNIVEHYKLLRFLSKLLLSFPLLRNKMNRLIYIYMGGTNVLLYSTQVVVFVFYVSEILRFWYPFGDFVF